MSILSRTLGRDKEGPAKKRRKSRAFTKFTDTKDGARELTLLVLDPAVRDIDTLKRRMKLRNEAIDASNRQGNNLAAQADKLASENKDLFK